MVKENSNAKCVVRLRSHASIADVISDTTLNAIEAGASHIQLELVEDGATISVSVSDDGKGMDASSVARAFDPAFTDRSKHPQRPVGLGLPILKSMCKACGGDCSLESTPGVGTRLCYRLDAKSRLLPPLGDVSAAVVTLFNYPGAFDLVFTHRRGDRGYSISRRTLADAVGGFETVFSLSRARMFLQEQETGLAGD